MTILGADGLPPLERAPLHVARRPEYNGGLDLNDPVRREMVAAEIDAIAARHAGLKHEGYTDALLAGDGMAVVPRTQAEFRAALGAEEDAPELSGTQMIDRFDMDTVRAAVPELAGLLKLSVTETWDKVYDQSRRDSASDRGQNPDDLACGIVEKDAMSLSRAITGLVHDHVQSAGLGLAGLPLRDFDPGDRLELAQVIAPDDAETDRELTGELKAALAAGHPVETETGGFILPGDVDPDALALSIAESMGDDDDQVELAGGKKLTAEYRHSLAKRGLALPDGSYPVDTKARLHAAAVLAASKHGDYKAARALIRRRAKALGVPLASLPGFGPDDDHDHDSDVKGTWQADETDRLVLLSRQVKRHPATGRFVSQAKGNAQPARDTDDDPSDKVAQSVRYYLDLLAQDQGYPPAPDDARASYGPADPSTWSQRTRGSWSSVLSQKFVGSR